MILLTSNSSLSSGILLLGFTTIPLGCVSLLKVTKYADFIVPSFPGCPFGIISVVDTAVTYELANIGNYPIYLDSPLQANIKAKSYFANPLVVLTIDYLGRPDL